MNAIHCEEIFFKFFEIDVIYKLKKGIFFILQKKNNNKKKPFFRSLTFKERYEILKIARMRNKFGEIIEKKILLHELVELLSDSLFDRNNKIR